MALSARCFLGAALIAATAAAALSSHPSQTTKTGPPQESGGITAAVDPRVELLSIIFRLAGNREFNDPQAASPYSAAVDQHFAPFKEHAAVTMARRLRAERGIGHDAVTSLAVHWTDARELKERAPFDAQPTRLEGRWSASEAREFTSAARQFAADSGFAAWVDAHADLHQKAAARMAAVLEKRDYRGWLDKFFGSRPQAEYSVIVSLLDGPNGRGVSVLHPGGREEIFAVMGVTQFDAKGVPMIADSIAPWLVHEFAHSYVNPLVDRHEQALQPAGERIYKHCATIMANQAYTTWKIMVYESLVRAAVVRHLLTIDGQPAAEQQAIQDHDRGFRWIGPLAKALGAYESDRKTYPTFNDFMPKVVEFFNGYAGEYEKLVAGIPQVVSMTPANGATDVDPSLANLTITFDRPMKDKSWSVVGDPAQTPRITGTPAYDGELKVLTVPVALEPGRTYVFWLNQGQRRGFVSKDGFPLDPLRVTFTTRKGG